jgi:hypothetical protein
MDMVFRDDECRVSKDHAPANFTTIKQMASNLMRTEAQSRRMGRRLSRKSRRRMIFHPIPLPTTPCMGLFPSSLSFLYSLLLREVISQSAAVERSEGSSIGRVSTRRNLVCGGPSKDPNHDAAMRIGSEAPQ